MGLVRQFIFQTSHMNRGFFLWKKKPVDPWHLLQLDSVHEIEKRMQQCSQKAGTNVYISVITNYILECRRFLPKDDADQLEKFLLKQYKLD